MSIVNFLVYKTQNQGQTETELEKLGYAKVTKRNDYDCHFWHLNECIILVKGDPTYTGFAGLGLVCSQESIVVSGAYYDDISTWHICNINGLELYLNTETGIESSITNFYTTINQKQKVLYGPTRFTGLVINNNAIPNFETFESLGFKKTFGDNHNKLLSSNHFEIMLDKTNARENPTVYADTPDIFGNIAVLTLAGVDMKNYEQETYPTNLGSWTHKIKGYNCAADGNQESYTIEKLVLNTPSYMDIILRQRRRKVTISETTLDYHFDRLK
tara:strand:+ start:3257 stop:4072 length:816 start_codon:yes stop_codon:yes gene_type:complete